MGDSLCLGPARGSPSGQDVGGPDGENGGRSPADQLDQLYGGGERERASGRFSLLVPLWGISMRMPGCQPPSAVRMAPTWSYASMIIMGIHPPLPELRANELQGRHRASSALTTELSSKRRQ